MNLNPNLLIKRNVSLEDIKEIALLEKECFFEDAWSENNLISSISEDYLFEVITYENKIIAYMIVNIAGLDFLELLNIAVKNEFRGNGLSKILMDSLVNKSKELKKDSILLEVRESNSVAISLYEKYGFKKVGMRKNYYRFPKENALLYTLTN